MSDDPTELTPEEQKILAEAPADTTFLPDDEHEHKDKHSDEHKDDDEDGGAG
jgi:hypothetical protein